MKYHKKLLKIFIEEELNLLLEFSEGCFSKNDNGEIFIFVITTDNIQVEIFTDYYAEKSEHALIVVLDDCGYLYPSIISKDEFWKVFKNSNIENIIKVELDE